MEFLVVGLIVWALLVLLSVDATRYWAKKSAKDIEAIRRSMKADGPPKEYEGPFV